MLTHCTPRPVGDRYCEHGDDCPNLARHQVTEGDHVFLLCDTHQVEWYNDMLEISDRRYYGHA